MMRRILFIMAVILLPAGSASWAFQVKTAGAVTEKAAVAEKDKDVSKPVLVEKVDPKYPAAAKAEKIQGTVKLDATIGTDGKVLELKAAESPDERLTQAAMDAVKEWKFKPALNSKGKPVKVKMTLTVNFKLQ